MCRTWTLTYTCEHSRSTRLSTCQGVFTVKPKPSKPPTPACCRAPLFTVNSAQLCGDCQRKKPEEELLARLSEAWWKADRVDSTSTLAAVEETNAIESFQLWKRFPPCAQYQSRGKAVPGAFGARQKVMGSLLKNEVLPEDVVERYEQRSNALGCTWDREDWGTDYASLGDELAENGPQELVSKDLPMTAATGEDMDDYLSSFQQSDESGEELLDEQYEQEEDSSGWSNAWSAESGGQAWKAEDPTYWEIGHARQEHDEDLATVSTWQPTLMVERTNQQYPPTAPEKPQHETEDCPGLALHAARILPSSPSTRSLPARIQRPSSQRRSTFNGGKMEIELRDRFQCPWLSHMIAVGGRG